MVEYPLDSTRESFHSFAATHGILPTVRSYPAAAAREESKSPRHAERNSNLPNIMAATVSSVLEFLFFGSKSQKANEETDRGIEGELESPLRQ